MAKKTRGSKKLVTKKKAGARAKGAGAEGGAGSGGDGSGGGGLTYAASGVDVEAGDRFAQSIQSLMRRTHGPRVIDRPGGFAGLLRLDYNEDLFKHNFKEPTLVACCDGVGTKIKLAIDAGLYEGLGIDLVAMSVNDLVVEGAEPLLFLDYIAVHKVEQELLHAIVKGISEGCRRAGCALIGGETAEMRDMYTPGEFDLAGFAVGVVELKRATDSERVEAGDVILGLESDGVHSNGYSLVRAIVKEAGLDLAAVYPELDAERTLGEVLLTPTRVYAGSIVKLLRAYKVKKVVSGMAHITGGGLTGNLSRALHSGVDAVIDRGAWEVPGVFGFLKERGGISDEEMDLAFNMGIGYALIVRPSFAESVAGRLEKMGERVRRIGEVKKGRGRVRMKG